MPGPTSCRHGVGRRMRRHLGASFAVAAVLTAACTGDDGQGTTVPPPVVTATTEVLRAADGVLRIGLLVPTSGDGATIGQSLTDAATMAVEEINASGGISGDSVELIVEDEGSNAASAGDAIEALLDRDVDAVVGPTSSTVALGTLGALLSGGVLACSPTATAMALDDYPSSDLFFRTAPSDTLQAAAIASLAEQTGARTAAVAYLDDTYGRPLAEATIAALESRELVVQEQVPLVASADSLLAEATQIGDAAVGVIVIIGDADQGIRLLSAIGETAGRFQSGALPDIIVNDAMRRPSSPQLVQDLPVEVRERVKGVSPIALPQQPEEPPGLFATNAYDCVNLIALAAVQAGTDDSTQMAGQMVEVSTIGVACPNFGECISLLAENRNIDYEGPGGVVQIGAEGDPQRARFDVFSFDEAGVDRSVRTFPISP